MTAVMKPDQVLAVSSDAESVLNEVIERFKKDPQVMLCDEKRGGEACAALEALVLNPQSAERRVRARFALQQLQHCLPHVGDSYAVVAAARKAVEAIYA